jgi:hypothetical protein
MFGVTMLIDELVKGLGIDLAQAKAVFEQIQKEAPDLIARIARIQTFDERLREIERTNQAILAASLALIRADGRLGALAACPVPPAGGDGRLGESERAYLSGVRLAAASGAGHPVDTGPVPLAGGDDSAPPVNGTGQADA